MSLDISLRNTVSGLNVQQRSLAVSAQNVARANEEDFKRIKPEITFDGLGGSRIEHVLMEIDELLEIELQQQTTNTAYADNYARLLDRIQKLFGTPDLVYNNENNNNIPALLNSFFTSISMLTSTPESITQKEYVINKAEDLCNIINKTATNLQKLSMRVDQEIYDSVQIINKKISQISELNKEIAFRKPFNEAYSNLEMKRLQVLKQLSEYIPVSTMNKDDGRIFLTSVGGHMMLDEIPYFFSYSPALKSSDFYDTIYNPITIFAGHNDKGKNIVSGGTSAEITTKLQNGKIKALLDIRDKIIPNILENLDNFSHVFANEINEVYSTNNAFPGDKQLVSKNLVSSKEPLNFNGKIRIALTDNHGKVAKYISNNGNDNKDPIKPLELDLTTITNFDELNNEINQYYHVNDKRLNIGDIYDIQLTSTTYNDNIFSFDFDADNHGSSIQKFHIDNISICCADGETFKNICCPNGEIIAIPEAPHSIAFDIQDNTWELKPGERKRSNLPIEINLNQIPAELQEFVVKVNMRVNNESCVVSYKINKNFIEKSKRYCAQEVEGAEAQIINTTPYQYVTAAFVNQDKNIIYNNNNNIPSYFSIQTNSDNFNLVIENINSNKIGAKNRNFLHDLDFDNLFSEEKTAHNSAINLKINPNLKENAYKFHTGRLSETQPNIFEIGIANNTLAIDIAKLTSSNTILFANTNTVPEMNNSFHGYIADIIEHVAFLSHDANSKAERENRFQDLLNTDIESISGVNTEEEVEKSIIIKNAYNACAQMFSTIQEMFKILMDSI